MRGVKVTVITCLDCGKEVVANNPMRKRCAECAPRKAKVDNRINARRWEKENRERFNERSRNYARRKALENPVKYKAKNAKHNKIKRDKRKQDLKKAEEYKAYMANYFQANKGSMTAKSKQWVLDHPEEARQSRTRRNHNRRSKLAGVQGQWTYKEFAALCVASDGHCYYCHSKPDKLTADHMIPLSRGGANTIDNIVPVCGSCNSSKGPKTLLEFILAH